MKSEEELEGGGDFRGRGRGEGIKVGGKDGEVVGTG